MFNRRTCPTQDSVRSTTQRIWPNPLPRGQFGVKGTIRCQGDNLSVSVGKGTTFSVQGDNSVSDNSGQFGVSWDNSVSVHHYCSWDNSVSVHHYYCFPYIKSVSWIHGGDNSVSGGQFGVGDNSVSVHHYCFPYIKSVSWIQGQFGVSSSLLLFPLHQVGKLDLWGGQFGVGGTIRCQFVIIVSLTSGGTIRCQFIIIVSLTSSR